MNTSSSNIVLKSLIDQLPTERKMVLQEALSVELLQDLMETPVVPLEKLEEGSSCQEMLDGVHFSWFTSFLRTLSEREIKLFLAALSQEQTRGLKEALLLSNTIPSLSAMGKGYLQSTLAKQLVPDDLLPQVLLPEDPLNVLLKLSSDQLLEMVDLLAMHDLSIEIKQVIDKTRLEEIYAMLSKSQLKFLKTLSLRKESIAFKRIGLANWDKDHEELYDLLIQRGVNRLAKALYPSHPSLLWYVAHKLDVEKGKMLIKLSVALSHENAYQLLAEQVLELRDRF